MKLIPGIVFPLLLSLSAPAETPTPPASGTPSPAPVQAPATPPAAKDAAATPPRRHSISYNPPKGLMTGTRINGDGGSRGGGVKLPSLYVLTPDATALTTQAQPSLFWYQSGPAATRFELTLFEPKKAKPLLKVGVEKAGDAGIHRLSLGKYKVTLTPGVLYKWTVALVPDAANRSQNVIAIGTIQRTEPDAQLAATLAAADGADKATLYASKGLWYDALQAISDAIDAAPEDKSLHAQRARLLEQVDLKAAAAWDRK